MVRTDRIEAVTSELARVVEATPLPPGSLPPVLGPVIRAARIVGVDLEAMVRQMVATSLRSLPSQVSADPARADAVAGYAAHLLEWVRDLRDDPPPADLPL